MKRLLLLAAAILATAASAEECTETGVCKLPGSSASDAVCGVLAPVGPDSIKPIEQAPRLTTLEGKTVAVVGGSFMASVTHPEIRRLIREH